MVVVIIVGHYTAYSDKVSYLKTDLVENAFKAD